MNTLNVSLNAKKHIGFEYIQLDLKNANQMTLEKAKNERISLEFLKNHWIAINVKCPEVYYKLDLLFDDSGFCTCPDLIHRKSKHGLPCKHILALDQYIAKKVSA